MNITRIVVLVTMILTAISTASADPTASLFYSLPSEYVLGQSSPTISEYNISSASQTTIQELKFTIGSPVTGTVNSVAITTGGQTFSAPVIFGNVDISGLSIPVPGGVGGVNIFVTPTFGAVGGVNGIASNTKSTISLSAINNVNITPVASSTMTLVSTKPTVYLASGDNTGLVSGQFKLADIVIAADQAGNLGLAQIPLSIKTIGNVNIPSQSLVIRDANNNPTEATT